MGIIKEFREFALKGNVVDLAIGVIIGGAFGGIVNSLIKDVIMPVVGLAGNVDFSNRFIPLNRAVSEAVAQQPNITLDQARALGPVIAYGSFITILINFIILAFCIFIMIKAMNTARRRFESEKAAAPAAPPPPPEDVILLREIRDSLRAR